MAIKDWMDTDRLKTPNTSLYALRCIIGIIICYQLYILYPQYPFHWAVVSVVVAISPDNDTKLAIDRMKANIFGCAVGLALFLIHDPNLWMLCIGTIIIIICGIMFRLSGSIRSALAALTIIMIDSAHPHDYTLALSRVACVIAGCLVALMVTLLFNSIYRLLKVNLDT